MSEPIQRELSVKKKAREETSKGFKHALHFENTQGDTMKLLFDVESDLAGFRIGDVLTVSVENPQTTLDKPRGRRKPKTEETESEEASKETA